MSPRDRRGGKIHLKMGQAARNENFAVSFIGPRRDKELRRIQRQAVVIRRMSHLVTFPSQRRTRFRCDEFRKSAASPLSGDQLILQLREFPTQ